MRPALYNGHIRKLWLNDQGEFRDHLMRLDADTRRRRFGMIASDDFIGRYVETSFNLDTIIHGTFIDGTLRGVGELRILDDRKTEAEAAFCVEPEWQGGGIGTALMQHTLVTARNRGIAKMYMTCLASNRSMQRLAAAHGASLEFEGGEVIGIVLPPDPSMFSGTREAVWDSEGWATAMFDLHRRYIGGQPART